MSILARMRLLGGVGVFLGFAIASTSSAQIPTPTNTPVAVVAVAVGRNVATIVYDGPVPGAIAGLMQVNFTVPPAATPGATVPLQVQAGGNFSPANLTMAVQ
jgi:uncharacterized protein (TIGR03437 family)